VDKVNANAKRKDVALSEEEREVLHDQLCLVCWALRKAIDNRTRVGRESGHGSKFNGIRVSLGSDDRYTDFVDYLVSLGCDACANVVRDPGAFVPPRNWEHFEVGTGGEFTPKTHEGFLRDVLYPEDA
jgi:hypothetical protein